MINKKILSAILIIVSFSSGVGASYLYSSREIEYTNVNSDITNVEEALNELYSDALFISEEKVVELDATTADERINNYKTHINTIEEDGYIIAYVGWHGSGFSLETYPPTFKINDEQIYPTFHYQNDRKSFGYYYFPVNKGDIFEYTGNFSHNPSPTYYLSAHFMYLKK